MKTTLLSAPAKHADELNWLKPLSNYLLSVYGSTAEFQQDLANFSKLRQDCLGCSGDATGIKLYLLYFSQLELLDLRIPVSAIGKGRAFRFVWYDAFQPLAEHKQHSLPFEKASVLFNLGSTLMRAASHKYVESQRSATDDTAFKQAVQYLQQAAGAFQFLADNFVHGPSPDLQPLTVKFLVKLCLAQSQEIFNLRVIDGDLEQKKNSLISKLCRSTSKYYEDCYDVTKHLPFAEALPSPSFAIKEVGLDDEELTLDELDEPDLEYNPDGNDSSDTKVPAHLDSLWVSTFQLKYLYYKSLSYYFHGLQLEATNKFGECIAYFTKSSDILNEIPSSVLKTVAKSRADNVYELLDNYKYQKDAVALKLKDITKDNDLIYNEIVPSVVTIAEPKPMDSAKVVPMSKIDLFAQINEYNYNNFLKNVVPINIHELLSFYSEEKSQFLRNEIDAVDVSNEELSSVLEYLNLPKALVTVKELVRADQPLNTGSGGFLDADALEKVNEISANYQKDVQNRAKISELRTRILGRIKQSELALANKPGVSSQNRFRDDLIKLKKSLYDAANSDARLFALVEPDYSVFYQTLGKGVRSTEFQRLFQPADAKAPAFTEPEISLLDADDSQLSVGANSLDTKISALEDLLHKLNVLKTGKGKLISELKEEIHKDDISDILLLNSRIKSTNEIKTVIFPDELAKFDIYLKKLDELIETQKTAISEVKQAWHELSSNEKVKHIQQSSVFRENLMREQCSRVHQFYDNLWKKYTLGLHRGVGFYSQLLSLAENIHAAVTADDRSASLTQSMESFHIGPTSTGGTFDSRSQASPSNFGSAGASRFDMAQLTPITNSAYGQPPSQGHSNYYPQNPSFDQTSSREHAPALPPKRPSQLFPYMREMPSSESTSARRSEASALIDTEQKTQNSSGLIYDQPSAYRPDMYSYFTEH